MRRARQQRGECGARFSERLDAEGEGEDDGEDEGEREREGPGLVGSLIDSLYDPDARGTFRTPLCRLVSCAIMSHI